MSCEHDKVIKDFSSDTNTSKVTLCTKCHEVLNIVARGEKQKEQSVWDLKDLRISRMSALKPATELSIAAQDYTLANVLEIAEAMEKWIYR